MRDHVLEPDRLADLLAQRNLGGPDLAAKSGLSRAHVHNLLNGRSEPSDRTAADVARALRCTVADFSRPKTVDEREAEIEQRRAAATRRDPAA